MTRTSSKKTSLPDYEKARDALDVDGKATGVTARNYYWLFRCYAVWHGQDGDRMGVSINPIDDASYWGAWIAYFIHKGMPVFAMNQIGQRLAQVDKASRRNAVGWLVPCDWPADFDADWKQESDRYAADRFVAAQARKREQVKEMGEMSLDDRQAHVRAAVPRLQEGING